MVQNVLTELYVIQLEPSRAAGDIVLMNPVYVVCCYPDNRSPSGSRPLTHASSAKSRLTQVVSHSNALAVRSSRPTRRGSLADLTDMAMAQALSLTNDLKLGWYTSIPPREMFACQILGTILGAITNCAYPFVR